MSNKSVELRTITISYKYNTLIHNEAYYDGLPSGGLKNSQ